MLMLTELAGVRIQIFWFPRKKKTVSDKSNNAYKAFEEHNKLLDFLDPILNVAPLKNFHSPL